MTITADPAASSATAPVASVGPVASMAPVVATAQFAPAGVLTTSILGAPDMAGATTTTAGPSTLASTGLDLQTLLALSAGLLAVGALSVGRRRTV